MGGIRGRLVTDRPAIAGAEQFQVSLELENTAAAPIAVHVNDPLALTTVVTDAAGAEVPPSFQRGEVMASPRWVSLPAGQVQRFPITIKTDDGAAPAQLDVITSTWRLKAGTYRLAGSFVGASGAGAPPDAWQGTLHLPPLALDVRP